MPVLQVGAAVPRLSVFFGGFLVLSVGRLVRFIMLVLCASKMMMKPSSVNFASGGAFLRDPPEAPPRTLRGRLARFPIGREGLFLPCFALLNLVDYTRYLVVRWLASPLNYGITLVTTRRTRNN